MIFKMMSGSKLLAAVVFFTLFFFFGCSEAPLIEREANRIVLVELFSTPIDE